MTKTKIGYKANIEKLTKENLDFRNVIYTSVYFQLVLMLLKPKEEIGVECHKTVDQFFRIESGYGKIIVNDTVYMVGSGDIVIVPMGSVHNVINLSEDEDLKIYTMYSPPKHKDGLINKTKKDAMRNDVDFDGVTTE